MPDSKNKIQSIIKYYRNIIALMPGHIYWKDSNCILQGCNEGLAKTLGLKSTEEIVGKTDYDLATKKEAEAIRAFDFKVMRNDKEKSIIEKYTLPNGETAIYLTRKAPLKDDEGHVIGILGISFDITRQKKLEEEVKKANTAKTAFIANMSHDIRTPITGMLGLIDRIKDRHLNNQNTVHDAERLEASTRSLLRLLNEIIDIVNLESGELKETPETFSLPDLIDQNIDLQMPRAEYKNIKLKIHIDDNVPKALLGPRVYLDRIILNLLSNAIKFTDQGHVELRVSAKIKNAPHLDLICQVKDTGIGIPKDQYDTIFEHFSRLVPSYQGTYEGSGLGLYTVKHYVDAMKGSIDVSSEIGKGTTFTITLPFQIGHEADLPVTQEKIILSSAISKILNHNLNILIVEDQEVAADAIAHQLNKLGITQIQYAHTGKIALDLIEKESWDLILMDIGLPDMTGIQLTQKIRNLTNSQKANIPIIALTGHAAKEIQTECQKVNIQDVYIKPLSIVDLKNILQCHLSNKLPSIDLEEGAEIMNGDIEKAKQLIKKYLLTIDVFKHELESAYQQYQQQNEKPIYTLLHIHIGTLGILGLPRLHAILNTLQTAIKNQEPEKIPELINVVSKEIQMLKEKVKSI